MSPPRVPPPDKNRPPQVGRRPSNPLFLLVVALAWIGAGIVALTRMHTSWHLVPAIVFIGVGLLYARGAAATIWRREYRGDPGSKR